MTGGRDIKATVEPERQPTGSGRRVALLVAINRYPSGSGLETLSFAVRDAQELARRLHACGFKVVLLLGRVATSARVQEAIERCRRMGGALFLFFFAGHGQVVKGSYQLHTYDSRRSGVGALPFDSLAREWHSGFEFDSVVALLDACRLELGGSRGPEPLSAEACSHLSQATRGRKRVEVLFGCQEGQVSHEDDTLRHGVFTAGLLEAFSRFPNFLTTQILAGAANDAMDAWSETDPAGRVQRARHFAAPSLDHPLALVDRELGFGALARLPKPADAARERVHRIVVPSLAEEAQRHADSPEAGG